MRAKLAILLTFIFLSSSAQADESKEFFLSCTYGIIAGTLVGTATLAFADEPENNLDRIAKGASLGLYGGILLGLYVVYVLPAQLEAQEERELQQGLDGDSDPEADIEEGRKYRQIRMPKLAIYPVFNNRGKIDGMAANYRLLDF